MTATGDAPNGPPFRTVLDDAELTRLEALGLVDRRSEDADERLELIEALIGRGFTAEAMVAHLERGDLLSILADALWAAEGPHSWTDVLTATGLERWHLERAFGALGLAVPDDRAHFTEADLDMLQVLAEAVAFLGAGPELWTFLRAYGSAFAQLAEAAMDVFVVPESRFADTSATQLEQTLLTEAIAVSFDSGISRVAPSLLRMQMSVAAPRRRRARGGQSALNPVSVAVAFIDLVGFTSLTEALPNAALADLLDSFESLAVDVVISHGGRVVKLIGDEVMLIAESAADALACAEELAAKSQDIGQGLQTRAGIAYGEVLTRGGDYFGGVVNRAARLAGLAGPREVLITGEVAAILSDEDLARFERLGPTLLKGVNSPVDVHRLVAMT